MAAGDVVDAAFVVGEQRIKIVKSRLFREIICSQ